MEQTQAEYRLTNGDLARLAKVQFQTAAVFVCVSIAYRAAPANLWLCLATLGFGVALLIWAERRTLGGDREYRKAINRAFQDTDASGALIAGYFGVLITYPLITIPSGLWVHGQSVGHMFMLAWAGAALAKGLFALWLRRTELASNS